MSNLSKPMRDVLMGATDEGLLTIGAARTVTALKTRGLVDDSGLNLTDAGKAVRAALIAPDQGDVNPTPENGEQFADWERELSEPTDANGTVLTEGDTVRLSYGIHYVDGTYYKDGLDNDRERVRGVDGCDYLVNVNGIRRHILKTAGAAETASQNAAVETNTGFEGEHPSRVVPNRKDKRKRRRIVRAFNRMFARKRDEQTKKRTDAAKAARKRGRKVSA